MNRRIRLKKWLNEEFSRIYKIKRDRIILAWQTIPCLVIEIEFVLLSIGGNWTWFPAVAFFVWCNIAFWDDRKELHGLFCCVGWWFIAAIFTVCFLMIPRNLKEFRFNNKDFSYQKLIGEVWYSQKANMF